MRKTDILRDIAVSLVLLTRLPLPRVPADAFDQQARAAWAFPLAGLVVSGLACAMAGAAMALGIPAAASAGVLLTTQIVMTGAMHDDGLADTADGVWGGFTPERRLEIMKDSHIGTYGVLALILFTGLRWVALSALLGVGAYGAVIGAAMLSRATLPAMMTALPPARPNGLARTVGVPGSTVSAIAIALAILVATALSGPVTIFAVALAALCTVTIAAIAHTKIGGQTGDILGATQVVTETAVLLVWLSVI